MRTLKLLWQITLPSLRRLPEAVPAGMRRDPAPTLWSYRYQRLMLTPGYRRLVRVGLPCAVAVLVVGGWFAVPGNRAWVFAQIDAVKSAVQDRPEFMVHDIEVVGADRALTVAIHGIAQYDFPLSSFDIDLAALRTRVTELTAVRDAEVSVAPGGILRVSVDQRRPVAVWRYSDGLRLIDAEGVMTGMIASRSDRADLPLIAGDGARDAIDEALALFAAASPVMDRVRGLVRMGERRWDMVLDGDLRILLPSEGAVPALERVLALHDAQELLDRDVAIVDMRLGHRPTLRLNHAALNVLRNVAATAGAASPAPPIEEDH